MPNVITPVNIYAIYFFILILLINIIILYPVASIIGCSPFYILLHLSLDVHHFISRKVFTLFFLNIASVRTARSYISYANGVFHSGLCPLFHMTHQLLLKGYLLRIYLTHLNYPLTYMRHISWPALVIFHGRHWSYFMAGIGHISSPLGLWYYSSCLAIVSQFIAGLVSYSPNSCTIACCYFCYSAFIYYT